MHACAQTNDVRSNLMNFPRNDFALPNNEESRLSEGRFNEGTQLLLEVLGLQDKDMLLAAHSVTLSDVYHLSVAPTEPPPPGMPRECIAVNTFPSGAPSTSS